MAKKNSNRPTYLGVQFNFNGQTMLLRVENVRENYGHDDGWPYQCDWEIINFYSAKVALKGTAFNGGYGGETDFTVEGFKYDQFNEMSKVIKETFAYQPKGYSFTINPDITELIDALASLFDRTGIRGFYTTEHFLKYLKS